jgi:hypothetical protein
MGDTQPESEVSLTQAVKDLTAVVGSLNKRAANFPTRTEVKSEGRKRAWKMLGFGVLLIIVAQLLTVNTISYCFLQPIDAAGHEACRVMPGYTATQMEGRERLARFELLLEQIEKNKKINREQDIQIQILEARLKELKNEQKTQ